MQPCSCFGGLAKVLICPSQIRSRLFQAFCFKFLETMSLPQRGCHNIGVENGLEATVDQRRTGEQIYELIPFDFAILFTGYIMITHFVLS